MANDNSTLPLSTNDDFLSLLSIREIKKQKVQQYKKDYTDALTSLNQATKEANDAQEWLSNFNNGVYDSTMKEQIVVMKSTVELRHKELIEATNYISQNLELMKELLPSIKDSKQLEITIKNKLAPLYNALSDELKASITPADTLLEDYYRGIKSAYTQILLSINKYIAACSNLASIESEFHQQRNNPPNQEQLNTLDNLKQECKFKLLNQEQKLSKLRENQIPYEVEAAIYAKAKKTYDDIINKAKQVLREYTKDEISVVHDSDIILLLKSTILKIESFLTSKEAAFSKLIIDNKLLSSFSEQESLTLVINRLQEINKLKNTLKKEHKEIDDIVPDFKIKTTPLNKSYFVKSGLSNSQATTKFSKFTALNNQIENFESFKIVKKTEFIRNFVNINFYNDVKHAAANYDFTKLYSEACAYRDNYIDDIQIGSSRPLTNPKKNFATLIDNRDTLYNLWTTYNKLSPVYTLNTFMESRHYTWQQIEQNINELSLSCDLIKQRINEIELATRPLLHAKATYDIEYAKLIQKKENAELLINQLESTSIKNLPFYDPQISLHLYKLKIEEKLMSNLNTDQSILKFTSIKERMVSSKNKIEAFIKAAETITVKTTLPDGTISFDAKKELDDLDFQSLKSDIKKIQEEYIPEKISTQIKAEVGSYEELQVSVRKKLKEVAEKHIRIHELEIDEANFRKKEIICGESAGIINDIPETIDAYYYWKNYPLGNNATINVIDSYYYQREYGDIATLLAGTINSVIWLDWTHVTNAILKTNFIKNSAEYYGGKEAGNYVSYLAAITPLLISTLSSGGTVPIYLGTMTAWNIANIVMEMYKVDPGYIHASNSLYQLANLFNVYNSEYTYASMQKTHLLMNLAHATKIWHITYNEIFTSNKPGANLNFNEDNLTYKNNLSILENKTVFKEETIFSDKFVEKNIETLPCATDYINNQIISYAVTLNNLSEKLARLIAEVNTLKNHDKTLFDFNAPETDLTLKFLKINVDQVALNMWYLHEYCSFAKSDIINIAEFKVAINTTTNFDYINEDFKKETGITKLKGILENVNNYFENIFEKQSYGYEYFYYEAEKVEELIAPPTFDINELKYLILEYS